MSLQALRNLLIGIAFFAGMFGLIASLADPRKQYAHYCATIAANTREHPFQLEQCRLTQVYGLSITEWDLIAYHYNKVFRHYPDGGLSDQDRRMQMVLQLHYVAHPDEDHPD